MHTSTLIQCLKHTLPEQTPPLVLASLRQDPLIWHSIHESTLGEKFCSHIVINGTTQVTDWTPGRFVLFTLNQPFQRDDPLRGIAPDALDQAASIYAELIENDDDIDLARAGMVSLALISRYQQHGDWAFLSAEIDQHPTFPWDTPLACATSMVQDTQALLYGLTSVNPCLLRSRLAIHALLSNPADTATRTEILLGITHGMQSQFPAHPLDLLDLIQILNDQNPELACAYCRRVNAQAGTVSYLPNAQPLHQTAIMREAANTLLGLEIARLAGDTVKHDLYLEKLEAMRNLLGASLLFQVISQKKVEASDTLTSAQRITAWNDANTELQSVQPPSIGDMLKSGLAHALAETGQPDEACILLTNRSETIPDNTLQLAILLNAAQQAGNLDLARQAGALLTDIIADQLPVRGYISPQATLDPEQIASTLVSLDMPEDAAQILELALDQAPCREPWLKKLITVQLASKKFIQAASNLQILAGLHPDDVVLQRELARTHERYQNWDGALREWISLAEGPHYTNQEEALADLHALAACSIKAGQPIPATHASQRAIKLWKDDALAHTYLGQAFALQGDFQRGKEYLTQATQLDAYLPEGWLGLAELLFQQGLISQALESLQTANQIIPNHAPLLARSGEYHLKAGSPTEAVNALQHAVTLQSDVIHFHYLLAQALQGVGRSTEARDEFNITYQGDKENLQYAHAYGAALLATGDPRAALGPLSAAIASLELSTPNAYVDYARAVLELNYQGEMSVLPEHALAALDHALTLDPDLAVAKAWRAEALKGTGNLGAAFSAYQQALETNLTTDRTWHERLNYGMGSTAYQLGRYDIAIASAQEAITIAPHNAENYKLLAVSFLYSNLFDDSLRAARRVLNLNIDDLANLAWYADHIGRLVSRHNALTSPNLENQAKQAIQEAQNALYQAIQLAPHRVDLSIKLSQLQQMTGDIAAALATINLAVNNENTSVEHLVAIAEQLQSLGDPAGAILCLEKAITRAQPGNKPQSLELFTRLGEAYTSKGDLTNASQYYEQAISLAPYLGKLYYERTTLLLKLGRVDDAFSCVETGISLARSDPDLPRLHILAAWLYRQNNDLASALGYAQKGMEIFQPSALPYPGASSPPPLEDRLLVADLFRAALQPQRAYQVLKDATEAASSRVTDSDTSLFQFFALKTELELDLGYTPELEDNDAEAYSIARAPAAWLASLSRIALRKGENDKADQYYQSARQAAQDEFSSTAANHTFDISSNRRTQVSLFEAALDFNAWQSAQELIQRLVEIAPEEPFTHLGMLRLSVLQAEYQRICDKLEVKKHAPGERAVSGQVRNSLENTVQKISDLVQMLETNHAAYDLPHPITRLERWHARAQIALCPRPADPESYSLVSAALARLKPSTPAHPQTPGEAAAIISATYMLGLRDEGQTALAQIFQIARPHTRNPWIWFQIALALEETDPREAFSAARGALQLFSSRQTPIAILDQVLMARIAWQLKNVPSALEAIEAALAAWPDEAGWHVLASNIYQESSRQLERRRHLEQAALLEPTSSNIQLELGKAYMVETSQEQNNLDLALQCLEAAVHLAPEEISAWIWLARAQLRANQVEQAAVSVEEIIRLNPGNTDVAVLQAEIALVKKSYQAAHNFAQSAAQARPEDPKTTLLLANTLKSLNRSAEALQVLESALPVSQDPLLLQYERIKIVQELKGANAALQILSGLVTEYPNDARILTSLAQSQADLGDLQAATLTALAALKAGKLGLEPQELANTHFLTGSLLRKSGQLDQAVQHLSEAVNLSNNHLEAYLELGLARKERREYHLALQAFELATKIAPRDPRPHYQAGLALKEGKDFRRAEAMLRQAASLAPDDVFVRRQLAQVVALNLVHQPRP